MFSTTTIQWQLDRIFRRKRRRLGLLIGVVVALIMLAIFGARLFSSWALWFTDRLYVAADVSDRVVIVAIDERTLAAYGSSVADWPRRLHGQLVRTLADAKARVVAFDVIFTDSTAADAEFAEAMRGARDNDVPLRTVLAVTRSSEATIPPVVNASVLTFQKIVSPPPVLRDAAAMVGSVYALPDIDGWIRRVPVFVTDVTDDTGLVPSLAVAAYMQYLRIPSASMDRVIGFRPNAIAITTERLIPVDDNGQMLINFYGEPGTFPVYSYKDVLDGNVLPSAFEGKLVLVGQHNAFGSSDKFPVPIAGSRVLMSGVEIHANIAETLLQNGVLYPPDPALTVVLITLLPLALSVAASYLRWQWTILLFFALSLILFLSASAAFTLAHRVTEGFYPQLALTLVTVALLIATIIWQRQSNALLQKLLDSATHLIEQRLTLHEIVPQVYQSLTALLGQPRSVLYVASESARAEPALPDSIHIADEHSRQAADKALMSGTIVVEGGYVAVPMTFQQQTTGVIAIPARPRQPALDNDQVVLVETFAAQVAPALALARAYSSQLRQKELLQAILDSTPDPVVVINPDGRVVSLNPAAGELFRVDMSAPTDYRQLIAPADVDPTVIEAIARDIRTGDPFELDVPLGDRRFIVDAAPLRFVQGGWVLLLNDVTALKQLNDLQTRMLRMAIHDLKGPLNVIRGYTELLQEDSADDQKAEFLSHIHDATDRMQRLVTEFLDIDKIRNTRIDAENVDMIGVARSAQREFNHQAQARQQALIFNVPSAPVVIQVDGFQIQEALNNLLSNAIKYTPTGGTITVSLDIVGDHVRLVVTDTGIGIPKEEQPKIFQPFFRVRSKETANIQGTGLGLSLVKAIVDVHKGTIVMDSVPGQGTTFTITLPKTPPVQGDQR